MIYTTFHFRRNFYIRITHIIGTVLLLLLTDFNCFSQPLGGTYSIGAEGADFSTYTEAIARLVNDGVSGQVTFKVKNGIYNEQLTIPLIQGASAEKNIVFESASGNNSDVVLSFSSSSSKNYTVLFDKAKYIEFRNHTLTAENANYGSVVRILGECSNLRFLNNIFNGISLTRSNQNASLVSSDYGYARDSIEFINNSFNKGQDGINLSGSYNASKGIVVENNIFTDQYNSGVQLSDFVAPQVKFNTISTSSTSTNFYGIYFSVIKNGGFITNNRINASGGRGIYTYRCEGSDTEGTLVINNMISMIGGITAYGISNYGAYNISFYNNSVLVSSSSTSYAMHSTADVGNADKTGARFFNNILINKGGGYAIYYSHQGRIESDYNNLLTNGANLSSFNSISYKTLGQLNDHDMELHSISIDPAFVSSDDLHARKVMLKGAGIALTEVKEDFDGDLRLNPPCIGADEFTPAGLNAELLELANPKIPFASGEQMVQVKIKNVGAAPISTLKINWMVNDELLPPFTWNGSLATGESAIAGIGNFEFKPLVPYSIKAWISDTDDFDPANDTLYLPNVYAGLTGNYTISKLNGDLKGIDEAVTILNNGGVVGPVIFNIEAGTYTGQYQLKQIPGSSSVNTVTFQASGDAGSVILEYKSSYQSNYLFYIDKSANVAFKKLSFKPLDATYSTSVRIQKGSSSITLDNNIFEASSSASSSSERAHINVVAETNTPDRTMFNRSVTVKNNIFKGGAFGIYAIPSGGLDSGLVVLKNSFENQYAAGVALYYHSFCSITENNFTSTSSNTSYTAVLLSSRVSDFKVERNKIVISAGRGFYSSGSSYGSDYCRKGKVVNNFISINGTFSSTGIYLNYVMDVDIVHNNVYVKGSQSSSYTFYALSSDTVNVLNNIFYGDGSSVYLSSNRENFISDYNCYHIKGDGRFYFNGVSANDFNEFKNKSKLDANSIVSDPLYTSVTDLHVSKALLKNNGIYVPGVTTDIDGDQRNNPPCIGADEFTPEGSDVQIVSIITPSAPFNKGEWPLKAVIKNQAFAVLTSAKVSLTINSVTIPEVSWSGSLKFGEVDTVALGNHSFNSFSLYTIIVSVDAPNGGTDIGPSDNVITRSDVCPALKGTYTIGGTTPDFTNLSSAVDALNTGGVLGEVTFNIRSGTYNEQISIKDYPGSSCENRVTFQSEAGDSTAVIVKATGTSANNYVWQVNKAKGITIKGITVKAEGTTYARAVSISGGSFCNILTGNRIESPSVTTNDNGRSVLYFSQGTDSLLQLGNNTFSWNLITGGSYGIAAFGNTKLTEEFTFNVEKNTFVNQYAAAINFSELKGFSVSGNTVSKTTVGSSGFRGITVNNASGYFSIIGNKIETEGYGIYLSNTLGDKVRKALIANNFIIAKGAYTSNGIYSYKNSDLDIYHNSVYLSHSGNSGTAFGGESDSGLRILNNILATAGTGKAISFYNYVSDANTCDYNNLYSSGASLGQAGQTAQDLVSWRTLTGTDVHSVSLKPEFVSDTDLHMASSLLKGKGLYLSVVPLDIDLQVRNTSSPDIGADEYPAIPIDVSVTKLTFPDIPFSAGQQDVKVLISNDGLSTITSVVLNWSVNGVLQPAFTWSGSLQSGKKEEIVIGTYDFVPNLSYQFDLWSSAPNGQPDQMPSNDSLFVSDLYPSMLGNYTIGIDESDFSSFTQAVAALNKRGIDGPVVFDVKSGTYNEQFVIADYPGSSCENTVTFKSQSGDSTSVILTYNSTSSASYIMKLSGAKGIIVKNMTFRPISTTYAAGIYFEKDATCNVISGNNFKGSTTSTVTDAMASLIYMTGSTGLGNNRNVISGNYIEGAATGIYFNGYSTPDSGNVLLKNVFSAQYYRGINIRNQKDVLVSGNEVKSRSSATTSYTGLYFYSNKKYKVSGNTIIAYGGNGVQIAESRTDIPANGIIDNNFISNSATGIYLSYADNINFYHNSVLIRKGSPVSARGVYGTNVNKISFYNNIFSNEGLGYSYHLFSYDTISSDYNVLYSAGSTLLYAKGDYTSLSEWQQASSMDEHSFVVKPVFLSDVNLHTRDAELDNKGIFLSDITTDIDGEVRSSETPDIGADEFSLPKDDAGISAILSQKRPFMSGNQDVVVRLVNKGLTEIRNVTVNWSVNNVSQPSFTWNGNLSEQDSIEVTIGKFNFLINQSYTIRAWSSLPNGKTDEDFNNDSTFVSNIYAALNGIYTVGETSADFSTLGSAVNAVVKGGLADSVIFKLTPGVYNEQISIPAIAESSDKRPLIIESASGNPEDVTIEFTPTVSNRYVLQLNDADHVHVRNLTLKALESEYACVVQLYNNADSNSFSGNIITAPVKATYGLERALVLGERHNRLEVSNDYNKFVDNKLSGGSFAIVFNGYGGTNNIVDKGNEILNNDLKDQYVSGISLYKQESFIVENNNINESGTSPEFSAIDISGCTGSFRITDNRIALVVTGPNFNNSRSNGVLLEDCSGDASEPALVSNNMISIGGSIYTYGISIYNSSYVGIYHNSVNIWNTYASSAAFVKRGGMSLIINNNIFANTGKSFAAIYNEIPTADNVNFNCYFSKEKNLISGGGITHEDLRSWRNASGQEANSLQLNPVFKSAIDLRVRETALKDRGTYINAVPKDIDGEVRGSLPDIGADEFIPETKADAGLVAFVSDMPMQAGKNKVKVLLRNYGADTLRNVTIAWTLNNIARPSYSWTGVLPSGKDDTVTVAEMDFFVFNEYNLKFWPLLPNGVTDTVTFNDTVSVKKLYTALKGTYTIGGSQPDFTNFTEAASALNNGGIAGPVTFNVRSGLYSEKITFKKIKGTGPDNQILFQSEVKDSTKAILNYNYDGSSDKTIVIDSASYLTFSKLTISTSGTSARVINITGNSTNITFNNNIIKASANLQTSIALIDGYGKIANIRIANNKIVNGGVGVSFSAPDVNNSAAGIELVNNIFENQNSKAIRLFAFTAPVIKDNRIENDNTKADFRGIEIFHCPNRLLIENNRLVIKGGGIGIYLNNSDGVANNRALIANNSVSMLGSITKSGFVINSSSYYDLVFNTVLIKGDVTNNSESVRINYCTQVKLLNNNIVNLAGNTALAIYGTLPNSDYNNYFGNGSALMFFTKAYSTLAEWKSSVVVDKNSSNTDPKFYSDDLLRPTNSLMDGTGISVSGVAYDVEGNPRDPSNPDIGAYEFKYEAADVGIGAITAPVSGCGENKFVSVVVANYGGQPQTGFNVSFSINGGELITESIGDTVIQPGKSIIYRFSKAIDVSEPGTYKVKAYTSLIGDSQHANDTVEVSDIVTFRPLTTEKWLMNPEDNKLDLNPDVYFSYNGVSNATYYNINIWDVNDSLGFSIRDTGIVSRDYRKILDYGKTYKWQVTAKNTCYELKSPIQTFKVRDLPDLIVKEVKAPAAAFSGQSIEVSWETENIGTGSTLSAYWSEMIYLSTDRLLDTEVDIFLGSVRNFSALDQGEKFKQTLKVDIPEGSSGKYYLLVSADYYNILKEIKDTNNLGISPDLITITLTPPPDLQVTSLIAPQNAFSGEVVDFTYKVTNVGTGEAVADFWSDRVVLSKDEVFTGGGTFLFERLYNGRLKQDSSYSVSASVRLPEGISGKYYIYALTDEYNNVYEHAHEGNNWRRSDSINVIMKPPADFVVSKVKVPASANLSDTITVSWTVTNIGGETSDHVSEWYDYIYLLDTREAPSSADKPVVLSRQRKKPASGESYTDSAKVILKPTSGDYFIYVLTDATGKVFEFESEDNNDRWSDTIKMLRPDLKPVNIIAPESVKSADEVEVFWSVTNIGKGKFKSEMIEDKIWVSQSPVFSSETATLIGILAIKDEINSGDSLYRSAKVNLPHSLSGTFYLYVTVNSNRKGLEEDFGNNTSGGKAMVVTLSPWADLVPSSINVSDTLQMGIFESLSYSVSNEGVAETRTDTWTDYIYVSLEDQFSSAAVLVKEVPHQGMLMPGTSYSVNTRIKIPSEYIRGRNYIHVRTDGRDEVYENTGENNNIITSKSVYINPYPPVNLAAEMATVEGEMASGKEVKVQWLVRNTGDAPTPKGVWSDAIYLSSDTLFNESDIKLGEFKHDGILESKESYEGKLAVQLPHGVSGLFYFIVVVDHKGNVSDVDLSDNIVFASDTTGGNSGERFKAFNITLTPSADLQITNVNVPDNFIAGQWVTMSITITNTGKGETIKSLWTNEVYLSPDSLYSKDDKFIANIGHKGKLKAGESSISSFQATLPFADLINYYLIFKADATNQEPEYEGEDNNMAAVKINQILLPPSDLVVTAVLAPDSIKAGQPATFEWILHNQGSNWANGEVTDAGYFSKDTIWDSEDLMVFSYSKNISLDKKASVSRKVTIDVPGVDPVDYYLIVRTDINNKVSEDSDTNNTGRSMVSMKIHVPKMMIGEIVQQKVKNEGKLFYSIEVPEGFEGESLLLVLKGDSVNGNNEMYVSHEAVPTRVVHDFAFGFPFSGNQEIVIPTLKAGKYYVYIHANSTTGKDQDVFLGASILNFEIRSLHSSVGGNNGKVTVLAGGSKFDPSMIFHIIRGTDSITAEKVMYINPTKAYVTFNLSGAIPSYYDLVAINAMGDTAKIPDGFQVVEGGRPNLVTYVNAPNGVRGRRIVPVAIEFINNGEVDMENAVVYISSKGGAPVALTDKDLKDASKTVSVLLTEQGGPQGVVRPGARGSVTIYTQSTGYLNFIIKAPGVNIVNK